MEPIQEVKETAAVDLGALLDAGDDATVTLVAGDTRLVAHRAVLAARSPLFAATFRCSGQQQVVVPYVEGPVLRQLVTYLYTLQAPQLPGTAHQLLPAADKYGLSVLKAHCERQVAAQLTAETAAATAVLAIRHSYTSLRKAAIDFIKANLVQVMATQGWADAVRSHPEVVVEMSRMVTDRLGETSAPATGHSCAAAGTDCQPNTDRGRIPTAAVPPTARHPAPAPSGITSPHVNAPATGNSRAAPATEHPINSFRATIIQALWPTPSSPTSSPDGAVTSSVRTPAPAARGTDPGPDSDRQWTAVAAGPHVARGTTAPADDAAVSRVRRLSGREKGRRLIQAAATDAVRKLQVLLAAGADVEVRDADMYHRTPLHWAAAQGHVRSARCLLEGGAEVDSRNILGSTPLLLAAEHGRTDVVRLLVRSSARLDAENEYGMTPLHYAAQNGHTDAAAVLLQAGADRWIRDNQGKTPQDLARQYLHQKLIHLLRQR